MRIPKYLSPTSVSLWYKDRREFYIKYLADKRQPRMPQTEPMAVGSAFDAYIKNYLAKCLGMEEAESSLDLDYLLCEQVEPQNRDFAIEAGKHCFVTYKNLGATANLMKELERAHKVAFESTVEASVNSLVPLLGKPDLYYYSDDILYIYDWKVNGYCSKSGASPTKGYVRLLTSGKPVGTHKLAAPGPDGICTANYMHELNMDWANQLCIYGWVLGGFDREVVVGIDQLACKPKDGVVGIRVASLRNRLSSSFKADLWARCLDVWERIQCGQIFDTDNAATIAALEQEADAFIDDGSDNEQWYTSMMRSW